MVPVSPLDTIHQPMAPCAPIPAPTSTSRPVQPGGMRFVASRPRNPRIQTAPMIRPSCRWPHSHQ